MEEHRAEPGQDEPTGDQALRQRAIRRLKKKAEFRQHLTVYAVVNGFLVGVWAFTSPGGYFWPIWPILGWGVAIVLHAWETFGRRQELTDEQIRREMDKLR